MSGFPRDWLAMREPYDHAARDAALGLRLSEWLGAKPDARIMDLGCGSGSNLRYLESRLPHPQYWHLVDHDSALLETLATSEGFDPGRHHVLQMDLTGLAGLPFGDSDAVVASALMDLVSAAWFASLAGECRQAGTALLVALDYDGRMRWTPGLPDDDWITEQFNTHQERDKGFGPAMGPAADRIMTAVLEDLGYRVSVARSPWDLGPQDAAIQIELLDGITAACVEGMPGDKQRITDWSTRRREAIDCGCSGLWIGHGDLLALPPGPLQ